MSASTPQPEVPPMNPPAPACQPPRRCRWLGANALRFLGRKGTKIRLTFDPASQIDALSTAIEMRPKSARWRLRSRIGDRMTWYREPEEVGH